MDEREKNSEEVYQVEEREGVGTYITDINKGRRFFGVGGKWFWLTGPNCPFDEDTILPSAIAEKLSQIAQAVKTTQKQPLSPSLK